jgi:hypothetical protein
MHSTISEDTVAQDVHQDHFMSLDLTLSTISKGTATQNIRKKDKSISNDLFLSEDGRNPNPLSICIPAQKR